jgi:hypothetical protein
MCQEITLNKITILIDKYTDDNNDSKIILKQNNNFLFEFIKKLFFNKDNFEDEFININEKLQEKQNILANKMEKGFLRKCLSYNYNNNEIKKSFNKSYNIHCDNIV